MQQHTLRKSFVLTTLLLLQAALCTAQEDRNVQIMKKLFGKLTASLTSGTNGASAGQTFLVLMNPGILVDPNLNPGVPEGRYILANTLNQVPSVNWLLSNDSGKTVDQVYKMILDFSEWGYVEPTVAQQKQLKKARDLLYVNGNPGAYSKAMQAYEQYAERYQQAVTAYEVARNDKDNGKIANIPSAVVNQRSKALQQWQTLGRKNDIETALSTERSLTATTASWFSDLHNTVEQYRENYEGGVFLQTATYPSYPTWFADTGWTRVTFIESEIEKQSESNRTSLGGGGGFGWGLWRVSASASHSESDSFYKSDVKNLNIEMEIKRVSILRPWLNPLIFESPLWRFSKQGPFGFNQVVSDGKGSATTAPEGIMPLYPTAVLLARNVHIRGEEGNDLQKSFESYTSGGGSVGWGPFAVGAHYNREQKRSYSKAVKIENGIEIQDPQIIGWFCKILRKTPDPTNDPKVKWLSDDESEDPEDN